MMRIRKKENLTHYPSLEDYRKTLPSSSLNVGTEEKDERHSQTVTQREKGGVEQYKKEWKFIWYSHGANSHMRIHFFDFGARSGAMVYLSPETEGGKKTVKGGGLE